MAGEPVDNRIYTIYTQSGKVFDVWNGLKSDNTIVWTYTYNGDMCQEWKFIKYGTDYVIQDTNSQKYLTVVNTSSASASELAIRDKPSSGYYSSQIFDMVGIISARALESYEEAVFYGDIIYTNEFSPYYTNGITSLTKPS